MTGSGAAITSTAEPLQPKKKSGKHSLQQLELEDFSTKAAQQNERDHAPQVNKMTMSAPPGLGGPTGGQAKKGSNQLELVLGDPDNANQAQMPSTAEADSAG